MIRLGSNCANMHLFFQNLDSTGFYRNGIQTLIVEWKRLAPSYSATKNCIWRRQARQNCTFYGLRKIRWNVKKCNFCSNFASLNAPIARSADIIESGCVSSQACCTFLIVCSHADRFYRVYTYWLLVRRQRQAKLHTGSI